MAKTAVGMKNFEKSLNRLEEIVLKLETGESSLDELLKLYEEGSKLVMELKENLDSASARLNELAVLGDEKEEVNI